MNLNLLLFAGTGDGRALARRFVDLPVRATVCVATGYGRETLADLADRFDIRAGRLDEDAIRALIRETGAALVIDATHPYAVAVSANIRAAAASAGVPALRLLRQESPKGMCLYVDTTDEAAAVLAAMPGNALLATGAKELAAYTTVPDYAGRMFPRVLPTEESIRECMRLGFRRGHIIAMQGPFGRELNLAIMKHFDIAVMVTKDGGAEGGFPEKMLAAEEAGVRVIVVGRPNAEEGLTADEILEHVRRELEARQ